MKSLLISEILYWVIALISFFQIFQNWNLNRNKAYIFIFLLYYLFLWHFLEGILEINILKINNAYN